MRQINGDWWPDRDQTCHRVAYCFDGAETAASRCRKWDLVIQAGGNVGAWPRFLRKKFGRVVTFEPSIENYGLMLKNLSGLDIEMHPSALGAKSGRCSVQLNPRNCGDDRTAEGDEVEVIAIDDLHLDPDLIYLDIQGDEYPALVGAVKTLERCSPVVGIEWDRGIRRHQDPRPFLESLGYVLSKQVKQDWIYVR